MTDIERIEMGNRIKKAREMRSMTLEDIANDIGVARSTIQRYQTGRILKPKIPVVNAIADSLKVNPSWLVGKSDEMETQKSTTFSAPNLHPITKTRLPLFDGIAAGQPRLIPDGIEVYVEVTTEIRADFVLKVHGDSMIGARIHDGDLVFIRQQPIVENGEIAAVAIGDEATLKRVFWYANKTLLVLRAENSEYKDLEFSGEDLESIKILGKAIAFQSDVR